MFKIIVAVAEEHDLDFYALYTRSVFLAPNINDFKLWLEFSPREGIFRLDQTDVD